MVGRLGGVLDRVNEVALQRHGVLPLPAQDCRRYKLQGMRDVRWMNLLSDRRIGS